MPFAIFSSSGRDIILRSYGILSIGGARSENPLTEVQMRNWPMSLRSLTIEDDPRLPKVGNTRTHVHGVDHGGRSPVHCVCAKRKGDIITGGGWKLNIADRPGVCKVIITPNRG